MRQNIIPDPAKRLFDAYMDFSGGLNSTIANDKLRDNEFPILKNVDLSGRGSLKRRYGRRLVAEQTGTAQGIFQFYRQGQNAADIFVAINGQLYVLSDVTVATWDQIDSMSWDALQSYNWNTLPTVGNFVQVSLTDGGNPFTFQTTQPVNGVQYKDTLYIATGTKLVQVAYPTLKTWAASTAYSVEDTVQIGSNFYKCVTAGTSGSTQPSGTVGNTVTDGTVTWYVQATQWIGRAATPYTPTVQEAIYIGTNGLAPNPNAYIQDGTQASGLSVTGIAPNTQTGAVQQVTQFTAYLNKAATITSVDYKWEYQKITDSTWTLGMDWTQDTIGKTWSFTPDTAVTYNIRVTVRDHNVTTTTNGPFVLSSYTVNPVAAKPSPSPSGIQTCNQCMIYWDRLLLWGDTTNPYQLYISDLDAFTYFPVDNTINFDTGKQESIVSMVRFSDMLYVFTNTTIQGLGGKSPGDYNRFLINDSVGCVAPLTARVVNNAIIFLANEGVFQLMPNLYRPELGMVKRIDYPIRFQVTPDTDACAWVQDAQYWLAFPSQSILFRLYYDNGVWVQDESSRLNIIQFYQYGASIYNLTKDGKLYKHDRTTWTDDKEVYTMTAESKFFDMEASFNQKKLRRIYMLVKAQTSPTPLSVTIKADSTPVMNPTTEGYASVVNGNVVWNPATTTPNWEKFYGTSTVGSAVVGSSILGTADLSVDWISIHGKARRVKVKIEHTDANPCEVYGFGMEYKLKRANAR